MLLLQPRPEMLLLWTLVCFSSLLQTSLSTPILASKPKPVDLAFTCMSVIDPNNPDTKLDDVPVILIHGLGGNKESWHGVFEVIALDTKKEVCVVDLRNHGQSPWNDEEYDVIALTEDVKHFMDRIKASKAIVLGHSLGGRTAIHLAMTYPERVEKLIVEDMRPNGVIPEALKGSQLYVRALKELKNHLPQGLTEREAKEEVLKAIQEKFVKWNSIYKEDDLSFIPIKCSDGKCKLNINPILFDVVLRNITELINESSGHFDRPTLFIYGGDSSFKVGEDESNIKKLFPNAKLVAVEGAEHTPHKFKKFTREVIKFINN